jgi:hypothetical protein
MLMVMNLHDAFCPSPANTTTCAPATYSAQLQRAFITTYTQEVHCINLYYCITVIFQNINKNCPELGRKVVGGGGYIPFLASGNV